MNLRAGRVAVMVLIGIVAVSDGGCARRSDRTLGDGASTTPSAATSSTAATTTSVSTTQPTTTTVTTTTTTLQPTTSVTPRPTATPTPAPPEPTAPALVPGGPCTLGSHPDCIDPDGDGAGRYLLFGADCMASFPDAPELCDDLDLDGTAGYPDSG